MWLVHQPIKTGQRTRLPFPVIPIVVVYVLPNASPAMTVASSVVRTVIRLNATSCKALWRHSMAQGTSRSCIAIVATFFLLVVSCNRDKGTGGNVSAPRLAPPSEGTFVRIVYDRVDAIQNGEQTYRGRIAWRWGAMDLPFTIKMGESEVLLGERIPKGSQVWISFWVERSGAQGRLREGEWQLSEPAIVEETDGRSEVRVRLSYFRRLPSNAGRTMTPP